MSNNPETLRLYAKILEMPRAGDVPAGKRDTHGMPFGPGDITKAAVAALRFQADALEKNGLAVVDLSAKLSEG